MEIRYIELPKFGAAEAFSACASGALDVTLSPWLVISSDLVFLPEWCSWSSGLFSRHAVVFLRSSFGFALEASFVSAAQSFPDCLGFGASFILGKTFSFSVTLPIVSLGSGGVPKFPSFFALLLFDVVNFGFSALQEGVQFQQESFFGRAFTLVFIGIFIHINDTLLDTPISHPSLLGQRKGLVLPSTF